MVRSATPDDASAIAEIYNHYVLHTVTTFEETVVPFDEMRRRIEVILPTLPWLVCEDAGEIIGYTYACPWKSRSAYRHSVETTVYVKHVCMGKGIGTRLYAELLQQLSALSIHAVIGGIVLPNAASVALHEKIGFVKIGQFKEVGYKFGQWLDVGYWELIFPEKGEGQPPTG